MPASRLERRAGQLTPFRVYGFWIVFMFTGLSGYTL